MADQEVVKELVAESTPETKPVTQSTDSPKTEKAEDGTDRPIPYARFKEKVGEVKDLKKQVEKLAQEKEQYAADVARQYQTYYESEMAKMKRQIESQVSNPYLAEEPKAYDPRVDSVSKEMESLKGQLSKLSEEAELYKIQTQVEKLKTVFPEMDEEHVYAIKKLKPDWSLEDCAEHSHKHFETEVKRRFDKMIETKKEAAKKPIFGEGGKINIKPGEVPKNFKDAKRMMMKFAEQID